tara:strand:+ start:1468 stop:2136 length:669 start_codon:yes stop_codon:yes gene_type:complete
MVLNNLDGLIRKFDIGIQINELQKEFKELLPKIEEIGWWGAPGATHQFQFAVQSRSDSNEQYHECCGPQPDLNIDNETNPLTEGSFDCINDIFKDTYFEKLINMFPIDVTRTRILKLKGKSCYRLHRDMTYKFHIPIITNPSNLFLFPEQYHRHIVHLPADGSVYYTDTSVPHTFLNGGTKDRYHIVLSSTLDKDVLLTDFKKELDFDRESFPSLDENGEWI